MPRGMPTRECPACFAQNHVRRAVCPCGWAYQKSTVTKPRETPTTPDVPQHKQPPSKPTGRPLVELIVPAGPLPSGVIAGKDTVVQWVHAVQKYYREKGYYLTFAAARYVLKNELDYLLQEAARGDVTLFGQSTS